MQMPHVPHDVRVESKNALLRFLAYRQLSDLELRRCAAVYLGSKQGRKLKRGSRVVIYTQYGLRD